MATSTTASSMQPLLTVRSFSSRLLLLWILASATMNLTSNLTAVNGSAIYQQPTSVVWGSNTAAYGFMTSAAQSAAFVFTNFSTTVTRQTESILLQQLAAGLIDVGMHTGKLTAAQVAQYPQLGQIPLLATGDVPVYNLPGMVAAFTLALRPLTLAKIFTGKHAATIHTTPHQPTQQQQRQISIQLPVASLHSPASQCHVLDVRAATNSVPMLHAAASVSVAVAGEIMYWSDPLIQLDNPAYATALPNQPIIRVVNYQSTGVTTTFRYAMSALSNTTFKSLIGTTASPPVWPLAAYATANSTGWVRGDPVGLDYINNPIWVALSTNYSIVVASMGAALSMDAPLANMINAYGSVVSASSTSLQLAAEEKGIDTSTTWNDCSNAAGRNAWSVAISVQPALTCFSLLLC